MARSPLTLAASVTSALPRVGVVGVAALTEGQAGRFDAAVADLDDGRRVVIRVAANDEADAELTAEVRALRALTPGVRALLPFRAPDVLGETGLAGARATVVDHLPGYRVDPAHVPEGPGVATSLGAALAAVHSLPVSVVRAEGLPARTPAQVRDDARRIVARAEATGHLPATLSERWGRIIASDALWRFESAVVLDGATASSFFFEDVDDAPQVTGLLEWHGLSVGDPATDLQWLASAPAAADDVYAAYLDAGDRAPDAFVRERGRFYAELEFAKWLIHGHEAGNDEVVADAVDLLTALASGVTSDDLLPPADLDVDDAIALLDRVPERPSTAAVDTSMHTDAYDPEELSMWLRETSDDGDTAAADGHTESPHVDESSDDEPSDDDSSSIGAAATDEESASEWHPDDVSTAPVALPGLEVDDAQADTARASDAALKRWLAD
ncbi:phosphotransferase [Microbacterium koreense]|uniref:Phosphotransferase n=1 Tax=Microbacterium koreense TaxID=323761 RepID=A0ABW2ZRG2_9MICO